MSDGFDRKLRNLRIRRALLAVVYGHWFAHVVLFTVAILLVMWMGGNLMVMAILAVAVASHLVAMCTGAMVLVYLPLDVLMWRTMPPGEKVLWLAGLVMSQGSLAFVYPWFMLLQDERRLLDILDEELLARGTGALPMTLAA